MDKASRNPIMPATARPLSPHLTVYRWQIQMVTSIVHRVTGIFLTLGTVLLCVGLLALASGPEAFAKVSAFCASWIGLVLLLGWAWSFAFHLLNGIRHLLQDIGLGYAPHQFVRNGWLVTIGSLVLTALIWACVLAQRGGA
jgi:succinate dehydrogenase / fumarate reductase cytochrome b subunit